MHLDANTLNLLNNIVLVMDDIRRDYDPKGWTAATLTSCYMLDLDQGDDQRPAVQLHSSRTVINIQLRKHRPTHGQPAREDDSPREDATPWPVGFDIYYNQVFDLDEMNLKNIHKFLTAWFYPEGWPKGINTVAV